MRAALAALLLVRCAPAAAQDDPEAPGERDPDPGSEHDPGEHDPPQDDPPQDDRSAEDIAEDEFLPDNFGAGNHVPRDGEYLKLEARLGDSVRTVPDRGAIEEGEVVVFVTRVDPTGDEYVYLLEGTGGPPRMIHPRMGRVHLSGELNGERRIRPRPAHEVSTGDEEEPEGWQVAGGGWAEYRLVATPSPRDESAAGSLGSFERFLEPAPYVTGRAGTPGRLVDSIIVRWK